MKSATEFMTELSEQVTPVCSDDKEQTSHQLTAMQTATDSPSTSQAAELLEQLIDFVMDAEQATHPHRSANYPDTGDASAHDAEQTSDKSQPVPTDEELLEQLRTLMMGADGISDAHDTGMQAVHSERAQQTDKQAAGLTDNVPVSASSEMLNDEPLAQLRALLVDEHTGDKHKQQNSTNNTYLSVSPAQEPEQALAELRQLLLPAERQKLQDIESELNYWRSELNDHERLNERMATVISESLQLRIEKDNSVADTLSPIVENSLTHSVQADPGKLADALYPVMGPAIRKSINEVLNQTLETFNQLLEQSLSAKSLFWRFDAWRTGRSYPEVVLLKTLVYQVEQVFLIHQETSLLLQHLVSEQAITRDPDMVSSMLTAIQDFISDSFAVDQGSTLQNLKLGDLTVLVEQGPYAVLAVVVRGSVPSFLPNLLRETQEEIHQKMPGALQAFEGDNAPFQAARPLLERCLVTQTQQDDDKKRSPWMAYAVIASLVAGVSYWSYTNHQEEAAWESMFNRIQAEPGVVILDKLKTAQGYHIKGLRDPLSQHPQQFMDEKTLDERPLSFSFDPYISVDAAIVRKRIEQVLSPPDGVQLNFHEKTGVLAVSGTADSRWGEQLRQVWPLIHGIKTVESEGLQLTNAAQLKKQALAKKLQTLGQQLLESRYQFASSGAEIHAESVKFAEQVSLIKNIIKTARQNEKDIVISIMGMTDGQGSVAFNRQLALKRADNMREALSAAGIPKYLLQIKVNNQVMETRERSVRYTFDLY